MARICCLIVLLTISALLHGQYFRLSGKITNNKLEPLPLVSIQVKGQTNGTVSKEDGSYELKLEEGQYDIIYTMVGFKSQIISLAITKNYTQNIILELSEGQDLSEVIVKGKAKDRSEEIIRNVIRQKEKLLTASGAYTCQVYIKATQDDSTTRKNKSKKPIKDTISVRKLSNELSRMSMAEVSLSYDYESENRFKEQRNAVVKRGNPESLFYLSLTEGDFSLYNNLLKAPALSEVPFLSPVSYGGLAAYKFKMQSIKEENGHKIYTINVRPRQLSNVTIEGELTIQDSSWAILNARFTLPSYHIPEYDYFEINQQYSLVNNTAWMITRQQFTYYSKKGNGKLSGETLADYKDFELNKSFPKKYFGTEVSAATKEAYGRDSSFWQKVRTEPLTDKEVRFIQYRDSIFRATHTKAYLDSLDKKTNKITWKKILIFGQTFYNRKKERTIYIMPASALYQPFQFAGSRLNVFGSYSKIYLSMKNISLYSNISYGFRNHDINGSLRLTRLYNPFNRGYYSIELTKSFQYIYQGDAWINMIKRSNFYLNNGIGAGHGVELTNGLFLYSNFDLALRRSVSNYKTNDKVDSLFGNVLDNNQAVAFEAYNAVYGKLTLKYTPHQKYIREPKEKIILGSHWPTFYATIRKGIPGILNSKVNFDYLEFGIEQELKLGTTGISKYNIKTGSFISRKDLELIDYQFQRRGDPFLFMNPNEAFQSLDSTFPLFKRFYQGHYVHEFNGAILNKIPFLKKIQLREIAGGGFLIAPERNLRYAELFAGVERIFKWPFNNYDKFKLGVYITGSAANGNTNPVQFKIGITTWDRLKNKWN